MSDKLKCRTCRKFHPETKYYKCPKLHIFCKYCLPRTDLKCPMCGQPLTRNHTVEELIEMDPDLQVACKHAIGGCEFVGLREKRLRHESSDCKLLMGFCPEVDCEDRVLLKQLHNHMKKKHMNSIVLHGEVSLSAEFSFSPAWIGSGKSWPLREISFDELCFYICGYFVRNSDCLRYYIIVNATEVMAKRYQCKLELSGGNETSLSWTGPCFSAAKAKEDIWQHEHCLKAPKQLLLRMCIPCTDEQGGISHKLIGAVSISHSENLSLFSKLNPFNWFSP